LNFFKDWLGCPTFAAKNFFSSLCVVSKVLLGTTATNRSNKTGSNKRNMSNMSKKVNNVSKQVQQEVATLRPLEACGSVAHAIADHLRDAYGVDSVVRKCTSDEPMHDKQGRPFLQLIFDRAASGIGEACFAAAAQSAVGHAVDDNFSVRIALDSGRLSYSCFSANGQPQRCKPFAFGVLEWDKNKKETRSGAYDRWSVRLLDDAAAVRKEREAREKAQQQSMMREYLAMQNDKEAEEEIEEDEVDEGTEEEGVDEETVDEETVDEETEDEVDEDAAKTEEHKEGEKAEMQHAKQKKKNSARKRKQGGNKGKQHAPKRAREPDVDTRLAMCEFDATMSLFELDGLCYSPQQRILTRDGKRPHSSTRRRDDRRRAARVDAYVCAALCARVGDVCAAVFGRAHCRLVASGGDRG
jgi:hypothetical protein